MAYRWEIRYKMDGMWTDWETCYGEEIPEEFFHKDGQRAIEVKDVQPLVEKKSKGSKDG